MVIRLWIVLERASMVAGDKTVASTDGAAVAVEHGSQNNGALVDMSHGWLGPAVWEMVVVA